VDRWCADFCAGSPRGRNAAAKILQYKLYGTEIRLQRDCGRPCPGPRRQLCVVGAVCRSPMQSKPTAWGEYRRSRRGRSTAGVCTSLQRDGACFSGPQNVRAFRASCTLRAVFPSLRAHEPLSCRARSIGTKPAKYFNQTGSCGPLFGECKRTKCQTVQFTNRRMRTFIAAPSARKVNSTEDPP